MTGQRSRSKDAIRARVATGRVWCAAARRSRHRTGELGHLSQYHGGLRQTGAASRDSTHLSSAENPYRQEQWRTQFDVYRLVLCHCDAMNLRRSDERLANDRVDSAGVGTSVISSVSLTTGEAIGASVHHQRGLDRTQRSARYPAHPPISIQSHHQHTWVSTVLLNLTETARQDLRTSAGFLFSTRN